MPRRRRHRPRAGREPGDVLHIDVPGLHRVRRAAYERLGDHVEAVRHLAEMMTTVTGGMFGDAEAEQLDAAQVTVEAAGAKLIVEVFGLLTELGRLRMIAELSTLEVGEVRESTFNRSSSE